MPDLVNDFAFPYAAPSPQVWQQLRPVVVVGGGPVGLTAALGLSRRGIPVVLVSAGARVSVGSRAICTSRHSLEILDQVGVGDRVQQRSVVWHGGRSFYRREQVLSFEMPSDAKFVRPPMVNISQADIEQYLYEQLVAEPGIVVLPGCSVTAVTQAPAPAGAAYGSDTIATLAVTTPDGPRALRAGWVLACDGARSAVRESLGRKLVGTAYEGRYVIADLHWRNAHWKAERLVWFDPESNPGQTIIMHCQPDNVWRIDYQLGPDEDADEQTRPEVIRERIQRHLRWVGEADADWELIWSSLYSARALALEDFRCDNVLFVGDAAHLVPIFGVRGMNSGLEDASTVMWQLAAVIAGHASARLLDSYAAERRYAWEQNVANATLSTLFMTPGTVGYQTSRAAVLPLITIRPELSALVNPRQSAATHARGSAATWGGQRIAAGLEPGDPVSDVHLPGLGAALLDAAGAGFAVLALPVRTPVAARWADAFAAAFPTEGARVITLDVNDLALLGITGDHIVLVRPEGVVGAIARGDDDTDPATLAAGLAAGDMGSTHVAPRLHRTLEREVETVETVWRGISDGLDAAPDDAARIAFLAKAVLLLALNHPEPQAIRSALETAASVT